MLARTLSGTLLFAVLSHAALLRIEIKERTDAGLKDLSLADFAGKTLLLSVVPSLDTPVCALQAPAVDGNRLEETRDGTGSCHRLGKARLGRARIAKHDASPR